MSENIRKDIIQKLEKDKIKCDLLDLKNWFEIEEKRRILKNCYDELRIQKSSKEKVLWS